MSIRRMMAVNEALGRWIKENPEKTFAIATPKGVYSYKPVFTSHEEIAAKRREQEKLREIFFFDEAGEIDEKSWDILFKRK